MQAYYGISFPFQDSTKGDYIKMNETARAEIRSNLVHLLLTRKGSRYFLPDFGTRLYDFIFEQMDNQTFGNIEEDIREACKKFIPNLDIQKITVTPAEESDEEKNNNADLDGRVFRIGSSASVPYTAQVKLEYTISNSSVFDVRDFIIINL